MTTIINIHVVIEYLWSVSQRCFVSKVEGWLYLGTKVSSSKFSSLLILRPEVLNIINERILLEQKFLRS